MFHNGEIEKVMHQFEKQQPKDLPYVGGSLEREPRDYWKRRVFYTNGAINDQFLTFLSGYAFGVAAGPHDDT